eukprot:s3748_g10.t1
MDPAEFEGAHSRLPHSARIIHTVHFCWRIRSEFQGMDNPRCRYVLFVVSLASASETASQPSFTVHR